MIWPSGTIMAMMSVPTMKMNREPNMAMIMAFGYTDKEERLELKAGQARMGKLYVTSIDKNLEYAGEQALKKLAVPARSVVTVVMDAK